MTLLWPKAQSGSPFALGISALCIQFRVPLERTIMKARRKYDFRFQRVGFHNGQQTTEIDRFHPIRIAKKAGIQAESRIGNS